MPSKQKRTSKIVHSTRHSIKNQRMRGVNDFYDEEMPTKTDSRSSETQRRMYGPSGMGFRLAARDTVSWAIESLYRMENMPAPPSTSFLGEDQSPSLPRPAEDKELTEQSNDRNSALCSLFDAVFNNKASRAA